MSTTPDPAASKPAAAAPPHPRGKTQAASRPGRRNALLAVAVVAVCGWLAHVLYDAWHYEETDDAAVAGHIHAISAEVGGPVQAVLVRDNQTVQAGQVLVRLDPLEFAIAAQKAGAARAQAQAEAARARATAAGAAAAVIEARARIGQAEAQTAQARAQAALAKLTLGRDERLLGGDGAITAADVDSARSAYAVAQAAVQAAAANLAAARAGLGSATAAVDSAQSQETAAGAGVAAAEAAVRDAGRLLGYTTIVAPAAGRIGDKSVEVGDRLQAGQSFLVVVEPDVWTVANFKETQLARMHRGQPVEITVDALPGLVLHGRIDSVAPASGAEFALLPPDNATGNFTKVVQRVPVKIVFDPASVQAAGDRLRPGLSAIVRVRVR